MKEKIEEIANMLLLNGTLLNSPGLLYGRMGVSVFFFHYFRYTGVELFEDYAAEIVESVIKEVHQESPTDYECGLSGIGAGIEYLSQNGFISSNTDEILEDFDKCLCRNITRNNIHEGIVGLGRYFFSRVIKPENRENKENLLNNQEMLRKVIYQLVNNTDFTNENEMRDILSFLCLLRHLNIFCNPFEMDTENALKDEKGDCLIKYFNKTNERLLRRSSLNKHL
jgi:hypothetical protein